MLACNSGLRPGEQAMLEFSDIDLVHGFIHMQGKPDFGFHIKNYQDRYIPLAPEADCDRNDARAAEDREDSY